MSPSETPVQYRKFKINGIPVHLDSKDVVRNAIAGRTIEVTSISAYQNLYHVFQRLAASDNRLLGRTLIRQQVGRYRWRVLVAPAGTKLPAMPLEQSYHPKWGRYRRYAERLARGDIVTVSNKREAIKVRGAWYRTVPKTERRTLRTIIEVDYPSRQFFVSVRNQT